MPTISVSIKKSASVYTINIGAGICEKYITAYEDGGSFFVVDKNLAEFYKHIIPDKNVYFFEASESTKNIDSVEKMLMWLKNSGALRDGKLVAIGGGITGDTAGFVAAQYMRGIKLVQMPTTLLSMVDSSIGGKTGVNFGGLKNNIGAFHQPTEVIIDTNFLHSLSEKEFLNGLAESLKISCVYGTDLFYFIKNEKSKILKRDPQTLEFLIEQSCLLKAKIVERDEREGGLRKLLNFGHTISHAIESDSEYHVPHGYAVIIGMVYESLFALENRYTDEATFNAVKDLAEGFGYPITYKPRNKEVFTKALMQDKKAARNGVSLAYAGNDFIGKVADGINPLELAEIVFKYPDGYK